MEDAPTMVTFTMKLDVDVNRLGESDYIHSLIAEIVITGCSECTD